MRHPERHPTANEPFGDVGGQRVPQRRQFGHPVGVEAQSTHQAGHRRQQHLQLRHRVEDRFLVLLQIAVVGQRLGFQRGQQPGQIADQPSTLAPGKFGDVGVLLLRHDRAARRPRVMQRDITEFRGAPQDDVFGQPGQVDRDHRQDERGLGGEIPGRSGVHRVVGCRGEAELLGDRVGVESQ